MSGRIEFIGELVEDNASGFVGIIIGVDVSHGDLTWDYEILCGNDSYYADAYELTLVGEKNEE